MNFKEVDWSVFKDTIKVSDSADELHRNYDEFAKYANIDTGMSSDKNLIEELSLKFTVKHLESYKKKLNNSNKAEEWAGYVMYDVYDELIYRKIINRIKLIIECDEIKRNLNDTGYKDVVEFKDGRKERSKNNHNVGVFDNIIHRGIREIREEVKKEGNNITGKKYNDIIEDNIDYMELDLKIGIMKKDQKEKYKKRRKEEEIVEIDF